MVIGKHKLHIFRKHVPELNCAFHRFHLNFDIFQKYDTTLDVLKFLQSPNTIYSLAKINL